MVQAASSTTTRTTTTTHKNIRRRQQQQQAASAATYDRIEKNTIQQPPAADIQRKVQEAVADEEDDATSNTTTTVVFTSSSCSSVGTKPKRNYDPSIHKKQVYTVGVLAIRGVDAAYNEFNTTFNQYLTATAGQSFDLPIQFEMKPLNFLSLFSDTADRNVDFIYVNPSAYSCIESEYEAYSLVSQVSKRNIGGNIYNLKKFGGVIATHVNNTDINTIIDLKDKIIAAASISGLGSGQMQFREMKLAGLDYLNDPKQLIFTSNQGKVVAGILNKQFDVGFIRTDQLERSKDSEGNPIPLSNFKIIDPKPNLQIDGIPFPFQSSTPLYPEWNLASLTHVPDDISREVQNAMLAISDRATIGKQYLECIDTHNNTAYCDDVIFPCEGNDGDTKEITTLAVQAMTDGKYSSWVPTLSYMQLRSMQ